MGILVTRVDTSGLPAWKQYASTAVLRAARMAGRDALRAMRAEANRAIRARKAIKIAHLSKSISIIYPTAKETLVWKVKAERSPMAVAAFPHRPTAKGVSVTINKGSRKLIKGGFGATMASGHYGVFRRQGPKRIMTRGAFRGKRRQPIVEAWTTEVVHAFSDAAPAILERGRTVFTQTMRRVLPLQARRTQAFEAPTATTGERMRW